jgi:hypothetical protein
MAAQSFCRGAAMARLITLLVLSGLLAACSGVETVPDDTARFEATGYTRFAWRSDPLRQDIYARDRLYQADPIIREAIAARLVELGYREVARDEAEFLVEYLAAGSVNAGRVATTASNVTPYPSATINRQVDGASVDNAYALGGVKEMGNLLVVFVDPADAAVLWRVRISKVMEDANRVNENAVVRAVREGFATLPTAR